ncbi:hypothetical protein C8Q76DRAFT_761424 [Earliella scabrosa]|nr:hypothetical protein C8Q76DRAFT_761424 [Earliella scabrosa]
MKDIPAGFPEVDVLVNDNGEDLRSTMVAGHVASAASRSQTSAQRARPRARRRNGSCTPRRRRPEATRVRLQLIYMDVRMFTTCGPSMVASWWMWHAQ